MIEVYSIIHFKYNQLQAATNDIFINKKDPIDCETDPCHLAWITRDNRYLFSRLKYAVRNRTGETFEEMTEEVAAKFMREITSSTFQKIVPEIPIIYKEMLI